MSLDIKEFESAYLKARIRCVNRCCLLHADTLDAVPALIAEVKRLRRLEVAVATAWEETTHTLRDAPHEPDPLLCGLDDGSTVCVLPKGHPIPHQSADGRRFLYPEG